MADITLNDLTSNAASPRNIVLDDFIVTDYEPSTVGLVYWRWEDEPSMVLQFLGQQVAGSTLAVPFDLMGRTIRLFLVSRTDKGVLSVTDAREGIQTTLVPNPLYGIVTHEGEVVTHEGSVVTFNG